MIMGYIYGTPYEKKQTKNKHEQASSARRTGSSGRVHSNNNIKGIIELGLENGKCNRKEYMMVEYICKPKCK